MHLNLNSTEARTTKAITETEKMKTILKTTKQEEKVGDVLNFFIQPIQTINYMGRKKTVYLNTNLKNVRVTK